MRKLALFPVVLVMAMFVTYADGGRADPVAGLTNWWPWDGSATDIVGGADGTLNGVTFAEGRLANALSFDGLNDSVSFGNAVGNFGTSDFTIDFWIQTRASRIQAILEKRPICSSSNFWGIRMLASGQLIVELDQDHVYTNYIRIDTVRTVNDGRFHHVAVVREGRTASVYLDGTIDSTGSAAGVTALSNSSDMVSGRSACSGRFIDFVRFSGLLDELALYNRALTSGEIQEIANAGPVPTITGVSPVSGSTLGGTAITITGSNFRANPSVRIGAVAAADVSLLNEATISSTTPASSGGAVGSVDVTVVNSDRTQATRTDGFSYVSCTTADPFVALGGGVCVDGGWLPPGHPLATSGGGSMAGASNWWPWNGTATDIAGGVDGTLRNGIGFAPGQVGSALSFDGVDDSVSFGSSVGNAGTSDFTIQFWMRTTATRIEAVLEKRRYCTSTSFWGIRMLAPGGLIVELDQDGVYTNYIRIDTAKRVNDGRFHHVAVVREGPTASVYIDGALDGTRSAAGVTNLSNSVEMIAGQSICSSEGTRPFSGLLDELVLHGRALTPAEIQEAYTDGGGCTTAQPASDWVCANGGWVPPNHPSASSSGSTGGSSGGSTGGTSGGSTGGTTACTTVQPMTGWVCVNGGWVPPDHPLALGASTGCATPRPAANWVCVNGGWLPPDHPLARRH